jgi:hypothetical protein
VPSLSRTLLRLASSRGFCEWRDVVISTQKNRGQSPNFVDLRRLSESGMTKEISLGRAFVLPRGTPPCHNLKREIHSNLVFPRESRDTARCRDPNLVSL